MDLAYFCSFFSRFATIVFVENFVLILLLPGAYAKPERSAYSSAHRRRHRGYSCREHKVAANGFSSSDGFHVVPESDGRATKGARCRLQRLMISPINALFGGRTLVHQNQGICGRSVRGREAAPLWDVPLAGSSPGDQNSAGREGVSLRFTLRWTGGYTL